MFTASFWVASLERAVKTFAQAMGAVLSAGGLGLLEVAWVNALSTAALAALLSALTSVASSQTAGSGPSLGAEVPLGATQVDDAASPAGRLLPAAAPATPSS